MAKWEKTHQALKGRHGLREGQIGWVEENMEDIRGLTGKPDRVLDLINVVWCKAKEALEGHSDADVAERCYVDVSQQVQRRPFTLQPVLRSLTTSSEVFSYKHKRMLLPEEHLLAMGFIAPKIQNLTNAAVKDLSGERMALPTTAACVLAVILSFSDLWKAAP